MRIVLPDEVEDATDVDLKCVPPRIRVLLVQPLYLKNK
jgi:hypothetical protein